MAGDWIPITVETPRKPEVMKIARAINLDRRMVLGCIVEFWLWAQQQTSTKRIEMSISEIEELLNTPAHFLKSMCDVGWLEDKSTYVIIPRADHWLTTGAKARLTNQRRQQRFRNKNDRYDGVTNVTLMSRKHNAHRNARNASTEEKRREDNSNINIPPNPQGGGRGTKKTSELPKGFIRFWDAWPAQHFRKAGRAQCIRFWASNNCEDIADQVVTAVEAFKKNPDWIKDGGQYIPAPIVWLRAGKWETPMDGSNLFLPKGNKNGQTNFGDSAQHRRAEQRSREQSEGLSL